MLMPKTPKPPQEKKRLSYAKDRRNIYRENSKASRKNIPHSKALSIRSERHEQNIALHAALTAETEEQLVAAELAVHTSEPRYWKKTPDAPLGEFLIRKKERQKKRKNNS